MTTYKIEGIQTTGTRIAIEAFHQSNMETKYISAKIAILDPPRHVYEIYDHNESMAKASDIPILRRS